MADDGDATATGIRRSDYGVPAARDHGGVDEGDGPGHRVLGGEGARGSELGGSDEDVWGRLSAIAGPGLAGPGWARRGEARQGSHWRENERRVNDERNRRRQDGE